jgi:hypothetical protein
MKQRKTRVKVFLKRISMFVKNTSKFIRKAKKNETIKNEISDLKKALFFFFFRKQSSRINSE